MNGYLLDSDIAIELLRGRSPLLIEKLASIPRRKVFFSAVMSPSCSSGHIEAVTSNIH